ncbi:MAG: MG2 domain-containing protein, partial [Candidatus Riflebacteria bacterium]|nr:MG2 domain-containing protein [Candidatus Riflebacteria bacterium]
MKFFSRSFALVLLLALFATCQVMAQSRSELWQKVAEAKSNGLPQTAIEFLVPLYEQAIKEGHMTDAVKALCEKIVQEGTVQGNQPQEKIVRLEEEIGKADKSIKPLLNIILAKWYWHFYNRNSYRFMNRSRTEGLNDKDFTTWDLPKLFGHIGDLYENVLNEEKELRKISISTLDGFIEPGNQPKELRATLFDFFAHEALEFYMADAQSAAKPIRAFELEADSPALGEREAFLKWQPESLDKDSCNLRAVKVLQRLLKAALESDNRDALLDNDLIRLAWARRVAVGDNISENYVKELEKFAAANKDHPYAATAIGYIAQEHFALGNMTKALEYAEKGINTWPGSHGESICRNVMAGVLNKEITIETEKVMLPEAAKVRVSFRNLEKVYFKLLERSTDDLYDVQNYSPDNINWDQYEKILSRPTVQKWDANLDPGKEYGRCEAFVDLPQMKPGLYYLAASVREDFNQSGNCLQIAPVIVGKLGMAVRKRSGKTEVFIVNNVSGEPMEAVRVKGYTHEYRKGWRQALTGSTDKNGIARFEPQSNSGFFIAEHKGHIVYKTADFYAYGNESFNNGSNVYFFTDRAIYRPGQTIYVKGIAASFDNRSNEYKTINNNSVTITFNDPNGQEVKKETLKTNEFGSFSTTFIAPADRLTGSYSIYSQTFGGAAQIRVEEYKRPKFKVEIDTPTQSFQLDQLVQITGRALAYTGAKIDNAQVKYRVVREVRFPPWCWWYFDVGSSQEIAHGTTQTDTNGEFSVKFTAKPDRTVPRENEPVFHYTVSADVVDGTGETRSGNQTVRVGYTAMALGLTAPDVTEAEKPFNVGLRTTTLDGKGIAGAGSFLVYSLKQPDRAHRKNYFSGTLAAKTDKSEIRTWEEDKVVFEQSFNTSIEGLFNSEIKLPEGAYRIKAQTRDRYNNQVNSVSNLMVIDYQSEKFPVKVPFFFKVTSGNLQPGDTFTAFWATGYGKGPAYIEIEHRHKIVQAFWTDLNAGKVQISLPITDEHRGGFNVRIMQIKENREYFHVQYVPVAWSNKELKLKFSHMTSKMQPAQKDTWKIEISGQEAEKGAIEMVAAMYDASLDAFAAQNWPNGFPVFYSDANYVSVSFANQLTGLYVWANDLNHHPGISYRSYPSLPSNIQQDFFGYYMHHRAKGMRLSAMPAPSMAPSESLMQEADGMPVAKSMAMDSFADSEEGGRAPAPMSEAKEKNGSGPGEKASAKEPEIDLDKVSARSNLNETAFFYPHLTMGEDGVVAIEFTMPEALTTWKFLGFAHGRNLQAGGITGETITQKDLMVQPNPPRFLREGDKLRFTAKVTNLSDKDQNGKLRLSMLDPINDANRNAEFKVKPETLEFSVPAGESRSFGWELNVPETPGVVKYKVVGATENLSDGEEGMFSILSRRIFVTESLPLPIRGPATKNFSFKKLIESKQSDTLKHQGLTVEVTSNPAWYAVQALPYLMEFPHECSEQIFNRIYANYLASFIAGSDPKIKKVFETWKADEANGGKALFSNLEKNEHLKSVTLLETPWVLDAKSENEQKHKIGVLFDTNRIEHEMTRAMKKLSEMQLSDGGFPWFPGGYPNSYITLYIMTGFGRMRHLGVDVDVKPALRSLEYLDAWIDREYREIIKHHGYQKRTNINPTYALYLYGRSFFLKERPIPGNSKVAVEFFLEEARNKWLEVGSRQAHGHMALALQRFGDSKVPAAIVKSLKERSVNDEELGRFWRENEISFWWYRAEIETQAVMIEAFTEVTNDKEAVEDCKVWLLKQKQTQNWKTTKATADAIYALLLRGANLLASDKLVKIALGGNEVKPEKVEAGTGYYQKIFAGSEVKPEMGKIEMTKEDEGVAWGAVHWQYLEDMSKVTPHETNLKLKKTLFVKGDTDAGP